MNSGDMIQIQKSFRVFERELYSRDPRENQEIVSMTVSPGEVYLLTKLIYHKQEYPNYNYATIELLIAGSTWLTTMTLDDFYEIDQFIKVYDFKNQDLKSFESPKLTQRG